MTSDLSVTGLAILTRVGVHAWEQQIEQRVLIDLHCPLSLPNEVVAISDTIDYDQLCQGVTALVRSRAFDLIENMAVQVAQFVLATWETLPSIRVTVSKPRAIHNAANVSVSVQVVR